MPDCCPAAPTLPNLQGVLFAIRTIKIADEDCFDYDCQWNGFCHSQSILTSAIHFSREFESISVAEFDCSYFSPHNSQIASFSNQQSKQAFFGDDLV